MRAESGFRLEYDDLAPRQCELARDRDADHAGADDRTIYFLCHYLTVRIALNDKREGAILSLEPRGSHAILEVSPNPRMAIAWNPDFAEHAAAFAPLRAAAHELHGPALPGCADFNRVLAARARPIVNAAGQALRFVEQLARPAVFADQYEPRIFLRGEVQFAARDTHDVFNALAWLTFPRIKGALNGRHYRELERRCGGGAHNRSPARDALTLFDESGVIVVTSDAALGRLLAGHAWKELFWTRREEVMKHMRFYLLGHGLYAKMLAPFVGVTGRGVLCEVPVEFMAQPLTRQLEELDARVAVRIGSEADALATRDFMPVPLLGIPGWCADSEAEGYYDNAAYFRPPPTAATPEGRR
jgi:hypothetical protein